MLYPYRASSRKNQARFQWGVLTPRAFSEADGSERWSMRTECLVDPAPSPAVSVRVRCLQAPAPDGSRTGARQGRVSRPSTHLEVDGTSPRRLGRGRRPGRRRHAARPLPPGGPSGRGRGRSPLPAARESEELRAADGTVAGRFVRHREPVRGPGADRRQSARSRIARTSRSPSRSRTPPAWTRRGLHRDDAMRAQPDRGAHDAGRRRRARSSPCSIRPTTPPGRRRLPQRRGLPGPHRGGRLWCSPRRSSSTTTPRWHPRARATSTTPSRSTRSSPCGS